LATKDRLARPSAWANSILLPRNNLVVGERRFGQVVTWLHRFTGPMTPTCDQYVQYLLAGPTHQFLIDTDESYNLEGASFSHHTPHPSQLTVLRFPPKGLVRSPVTRFHQLSHCLGLKNLWSSHGLPTTRPSTVVYIYA
jgi:hypothetical protein